MDDDELRFIELLPRLLLLELRLTLLLEEERLVLLDEGLLVDAGRTYSELERD